MIDPEQRTVIRQQLRHLETSAQIHILYACESGSRAWGFPSADSDYDVRFLYIRPKDWYLRVDYEAQRDVVELPINDLLDINGWDLKKALKLLVKSNPALIEWLHSSIVYQQNAEFIADLKALLPRFYSPRACYYHYSHMAQNNYREWLKGDTVRAKKYFYVLRPILAMEWISRDKGIVPMEFEALLNGIVPPGPLKEAITDLLQQKRVGFEQEDIPRIDIISEFIEQELERYASLSNSLPDATADYMVLNRFFLNWLDKHG